MALPVMTITRNYSFEAAHFLPHCGNGHKCRDLHGHSYRVRVRLTDTVDPKTGWVMDFAELDRMVVPIIRRLDHQTLNRVGDTGPTKKSPACLLLNPTAENIARYIFNSFPRKMTCRRLEVTVYEGDDGSATYDGASA